MDEIKFGIFIFSLVFVRSVVQYSFILYFLNHIIIGSDISDIRPRDKSIKH